MGKISDFNITFGDHKFPVYRPGETMFGTVSFNVSGEVKAKSVKLHLHGAAITDWYSESKDRKRRSEKSKEIFLNKTVTFLGGADSGVSVLKEGIHRYRYRFELVNCPKFPSSFESGPGVVRYWLSFHVYRSGLRFDDVHTVPFTLLTTLDVNDACYENKVDASNSKVLSKALGVGNAGELRIKASLDRGAYCPGENILVTVEADNASTKTLGPVRAFLVQSTWYRRCVTEDNTCNSTVASLLLDSKLDKEEKKEFTKPFEVPAVPSSTQDDSCKIIKVSYFVDVTVDVPWGLDLSVKVPVTIGTIPYQSKMKFMRFKGHSESNGSYLKWVPSTVNVCGRKCQKGYDMCLLEDYQIPFPRQPHFVPFTASILPGSIAGPLNLTPETPSNTEHQTEKPTALESKMNHSSSNAAPLEESASLPEYESPPSYESLYASDRGDEIQIFEETRPQNGSEEAEHVTHTGRPNLTWKGALIGLLFSRNSLSKMMDFLSKHSKILNANDGRVLSVFDDFQIIPQEPTSGIFLVFDSEANAAQWCEHLTAFNPVEELQILIAENSSPVACCVSDLSLYPFVNLTMTHEDPTQTLTPEQIEKQKTAAQNIFPSLRTQFGGKFVFFSSKSKLITGDWTGKLYSPDQVKTSVTLWPTEKLFRAYVKELNEQPDFQKYNEISKITTSTLVSVTKLMNEE